MNTTDEETSEMKSLLRKIKRERRYAASSRLTHVLQMLFAQQRVVEKILQTGVTHEQQ